MRVALGATRGRIAAQMLAESLVLGALGGVAGVGLAAVLIAVAVPLVPRPAVHGGDLAEPARAGVCHGDRRSCVSILVGMLPAIRLSAGSAADGAQQRVARIERRERSRRAAPSSAAEVAVSVVLICGAVLLFKSLIATAAASTSAHASIGC